MVAFRTGYSPRSFTAPLVEAVQAIGPSTDLARVNGRETVLVWDGLRESLKYKQSATMEDLVISERSREWSMFCHLFAIAPEGELDLEDFMLVREADDFGFWTWLLMSIEGAIEVAAGERLYEFLERVAGLSVYDYAPIDVLFGGEADD